MKNLSKLNKEKVKELLKSNTGFNSSFSNTKTRRKFKPNLQKTIILKDGKRCKVSLKFLKTFKYKKESNLRKI